MVGRLIPDEGRVEGCVAGLLIPLDGRVVGVFGLFTPEVGLVVGLVVGPSIHKERTLHRAQGGDFLASVRWCHERALSALERPQHATPNWYGNC